MIFRGLQKTTLLDYPGKLACTVFLQGCNFNCFYCHNRSLIERIMIYDPISEEKLFEFLESRPQLDGIVISGGEPTINEDLPRFLDKIREVHPELNIKLDTNGSNPTMLRSIIKDGLVDYVAMDIKTVPYRYVEVTKCAVDEAAIKESIAIILNDQYINYEFRTTVVDDVHCYQYFEEIGELVEGCERYALQPFDPSSFGDRAVDMTHYVPSYEFLNECRRILEKYVDGEVIIRGVS